MNKHAVVVVVVVENKSEKYEREKTAGGEG
jgi:hypothetical protein